MGRDKFGGVAIDRVSKRLPVLEVALLAAAVAGISAAAPLAASAAAPALAIAFWRNAMGAGVMGVRLRGARLERLERAESGRCLLAGVFLAAHFGLWIPSLTMTSVAASTALVCTAPLWGAVIAKARRRLVPVRAWAGTGIAFAGVLAVAGVDVGGSARGLVGDGLALAGGACMAAYLTVGEGVRRRGVDTGTYTAFCYGTAAVVLLGACLASGSAVVGYDGRTWRALVALTVVGQLLGHSLLNRALKVLSGSAVGAVSLLEVPGAALLAAAWLGQAPGVATWVGVVVILAGVWLVIRAPEQPRTPGHRQS